MPETDRQRSGTVDRRGRTGEHRPVLAADDPFRHIIYTAATSNSANPLVAARLDLPLRFSPVGADLLELRLELRVRPVEVARSGKLERIA
jgi:hypothetical protein